MHIILIGRHVTVLAFHTVSLYFILTILTIFSRVCVAWAVFLSTPFECLDLGPLPGFVEALMPKVFKDEGFAETEAEGDATETWSSQSENCNVNVTKHSATTRTTLLVRQQCGFTLMVVFSAAARLTQGQYQIETSLSSVGFWTRLTKGN